MFYDCFYKCCILDCLYFNPEPRIVMEYLDTTNNTPSVDFSKYHYLYDDPEMELWFQRHCRTWGYNNIYYP